ncbi:MAG: EAL domain-containing protein [Eubacterium sp.]|nr:EAL domain-containing protein [Eubacterium sp.]
MEQEFGRHQFDNLTGLPLIGCFLENAPDEVQEIRGKEKVPAVLWMEFSDMREYYALYGFETGDALVCGMASLLRVMFGEEHAACFNRQSFAVCTQTDGLEEKIRRIFDQVGRLNRGNARPLAVGICVMDQDDLTLATAVDRAKLACESLNNPPHSSIAFFNQEMQAAAALEKYVLQNWEKAIASGWIQVYYQPVVRTITGMLCGAEALCRWIDPVRGMIPPCDFIPALEKHGLISRLDLYMIEKVCRDCRQILNDGREIVPVSVNLSRKDFRQPDLVTQIEALAQKYQVPRELLNIEITESAFVRHPERLNRFIGLFHELGFKVWMDDFGTAYSSLGALKDLSFDELKIDMSFLATSTDKARTIITSVVRMAKEIGIQTLAEGVETEEQYKFLGRIGCEKVQGYYFGRPMDRHAFWLHCQSRGMREEGLRWKNYYDAMSCIDFQTDQPLCLVEDDGTTMRQYFVNEAFLTVLHRDGFDGIETWIDEVNAENEPMHAFYRQFANEQLRKLAGTQTITYPSGDHFMELTGSPVAQHEQNYVYALNIRYIQLDEISADQKKASYIQDLYYFCSDIAVADLTENTLYGLKSSSSAQPIGTGGKVVDLREADQTYTEQYVYAPDQKRFRTYIEPGTLRKRIMLNNGQALTIFYRSRTVCGTYQWMLGELMPVPKTDFNRYLVITLPVYIDQDLLNMLLDEERARRDDSPDSPLQAEDIVSDSVLWKNLAAYAESMYFWKDRERRFLGASQSFLDFYGFHSVEDIRCRTDEDMHWHVEPEAFREDELRVLQEGRSVHAALGKCIVRGKERSILASKIPIYRDGKIIGLMGKFVPVEDLVHLQGRAYRTISIDPVTDLLNMSGFLESFSDYLEELWTHHTQFSQMLVNIPEYPSFRSNYGEKAGHMLLRRIGVILKDIFGKNGSIGRLTGSHFIILTQEVNPDILARERDRVREAIAKCRRVDQWTCAISAEIQIRVVNEDNASLENFMDFVNHMWGR